MKLIVWIEDDIEIIDPVAGPLRRAGYHIEAFTSKKETLEHLDLIRNADLILLDILLPDGSKEGNNDTYVGKRLLEELRANGLRIPVIVFSVVGDVDMQKDLKELGVKVFLRKPVLPSELKEAVDQVFAAESH